MEKSRLSEELHEDWCEEVVEDGLGRQAVGISP